MKDNVKNKDGKNIEKASKGFFSKFKIFFMSIVSVFSMALPVFAEDAVGFSITSAMVNPIVTSISSGLTTLVPIGITIMAAMIGISLIPRIIYKFL